MEIILGLGLLALTYYALRRLKPTNNVVHPWMTRDILATCAALGLVASLSFGSAILLHGAVKYL
ncbi:MAG: hypothetical protein KJ622_04515 [Alphaproteobacteria bacterium]|nr:hypothetical protein [Alphaproteobacteria bacterium]